MDTPFSLFLHLFIDILNFLGRSLTLTRQVKEMTSKQEGQAPELSYSVADFAPTLKGSVLSQSPTLGSCILTALKGIFRPMRLWQKEPIVLTERSRAGGGRLTQPQGHVSPGCAQWDRIRSLVMHGRS